MSYVALRYVRINGDVLVPGEVVPVIDAEKTEWLLSVGAIAKVETENAIIEAAEAATEINLEAELHEAVMNEPKSADAPEINAMEGIVATPKRGRRKTK